VLAGARRIFEAREQNVAPLDAAAIRRLASEITGHVITPYGSNYARLVEIKKKYDPKNVLRFNQNIKPDRPSNT
jgi:FAD/FMN-containing dehydrogenase